jgi:isopentenyl diphosphate isomerase/L-lactate dehydrogenase-like FMN-dependent dehydrogenase
VFDIRRFYNIDDFRDGAKATLPKLLFDYLDRGSENEFALRANRSALDSIRLLPRVLVDVSKRSCEAVLLGKPAKLPLAIAPMAPLGLFYYEGELATARAAANAGVPYTLATDSMTRLERIMDEVGGRLWFQLYYWNNRSLSHDLLERAKIAGYEALVLTVDTPVSPNRECNARNGFEIPFRPSAAAFFDVLTHPRWLFGVLLRYVIQQGVPRVVNHPDGYQGKMFRTSPDAATRLNPSITWDDVREVRRRWNRPLLIKGILTAEDAKQAVDVGADGVVVSNHGARNFDSAISSIEALPSIADAIGARTTILMDSGVRRGSDIIKALALGANGVLVGRPVAYALAADGERGVDRALEILAMEVDKSLAFMGCNNLGALGSHIMHRRC